jgi:hypothetical protein
MSWMLAMPLIDAKLQKSPWKIARYKRTSRKRYLPFEVALTLSKSYIFDCVWALLNKMIGAAAEVAGEGLGATTMSRNIARY